MAAAHISIQSTEWGNKLKAFRNAVALVVAEGPALKAKMDAMIDTAATPDDYTQLETQFGLEGGKGETLWGEHATLVLALQANPASEAATAGDAALLATKLAQYINVVG
jgi:hypothetical protein